MALALAFAFAVPARADERPGAALRAGVEALRASRFDVAEKQLREVERRWPWIGDHAARLAIEAALGARRADDALAAAREFASRYPDSPLAARVARLRGDAASEAGRPEDARRAWREALAGERDPAARAALLVASGRTSQELGDARDAAGAARDAWIAAPTSPDASAAEALLERLEAQGAAPARSAADWSRRGDALLAAGAHDAALAAYARALALAPPPAVASALRRQQAFTLFRARRYPEARAAFEALGDDPESRFYAARATARAGEPAAAIEVFEALGAGRSPFAAQARLLAATLLDDVPETTERAAAHYRAVAADADDPAQRREAHWRLAWLRYRAGRYPEARDELARQASEEEDPIEALRPRYWALRARERAGEAGNPALAQAYTELGREYPLAYYGWRASLRARRAAEPAAGPAASPASAASTAAAAAGPASALPAVGLARVEALVEADLADEADAELARLAAPDLADGDRERLGALAASVGNFERASAIAGAGRAEILARGPVTGREGIWRLAWPRAFEADVRRAAAAAGIRPELAWSIMREESAFKPDAISPVGARGLLQLMPETAARVAPDLGLAPPAPEALYEPELNVRLGTALLADLVREFDGRVPLAIGGYNAGAAAVERWLAEAPALVEDEWIESIPYDETRAYVRRVLRSLRAYEVLYAP
ncbi:MAG TPA: lytic transglycosylase domain-containing protein [Myxococcota bacterium]|nr:lytic transglycosylase domain-containing protein [Myxococcota bacterium]